MNFILIFLVGLILGLSANFLQKYQKQIDLTTNSLLILMLFFIGASIGSHHEIFNQIVEIGYQSLLLALLPIIGSFAIFASIKRWVN